MTDAPEPNTDDVLVLANGRRIAFAEFGDPHGAPVLWFHGTPGSRTQLPPAAHETAARRGLRIIGVDRPGFGRSTHDPDRTLLDWAGDTEELADRLDLEAFAVVGLSGGGPYVLACAHELPERVTVAISLGGVGPLQGDEVAPGYPRLLHEVGKARLALHAVQAPLGNLVSTAVRMLTPFAEEAIDVYRRLAPRSDRHVFELPGFREMFISSTLDAIPHGLHGAVRDLVVFSQPWGFSPRDIKIPVRFFHGEADGIVPLSHGRFLADLVPDSHLVVQPGEGHFAGFVCVDEVLDIVIEHAHPPEEQWPRTLSD